MRDKDREYIEELVKRHNELTGTIAANISDGLVITDANLDITYANPKIEELYGISVPEMRGKPLGVLVTDQQRTEISRNILEIVSSGGKYKETFQNQRKGGTTFLVEINVHPVHEKQGPPQLYVVIFRDIASRDDIEETLRESEEKYRMMIENLNEIIYTLDTEARVTYISPNSEYISGYRPDELIGRKFINYVHPDDIKNRLAQFNQILSGKSEPSEYRMMTKEGKPVWVRTKARKLVKNGKTVGIQGVLTEINDLKRKEQELIKAKEKAEESNKLKSAFLANMSHEIRTPMNGIIGFAELLKDPGITEEKQDRFLSVIKNSGERMLNIINDLISISKIESGQMEVSITNLNISEQLNVLLDLYTPEACKKGISLFLHHYSKKNRVVIETDSEKVYTILTNLIKNAIKFTNKGSVEFGCEAKNNFLEFFVKDTGIGIPENKREIIFSRFGQADSSIASNYDGAGLGLSISKAYIEMLGGQIWFESEEGKGTSFYFTIPATIQHDNVLQANNESVPGKGHFPNYTVLVAEDDQTSALYLKMILEKKGLNLLMAKSGGEAVDLYKKHMNIIDLVLMDIKMPDMDGYTAAGKIKGINPGLPVIAQTAYALESDVENFRDIFDGYITKPIKAGDLYKAVQKCLGISGIDN